MLAHRLAFFREGEDEVEKQGGLQNPGGDVAPIDRPVEIVQLAGVLERIGNEGDEAENVEVGGAGSGPAAQQDVEADAEIDERNQPQPVVERTLRGNQNDAGIERDRLPEQGIRGFRPDAGAVELALQSRHILDILPVDGNQLVAGFNAASCPWSVGIDPVGSEVPALLDPPDAVVGNQELPLGVEIEAGEDDRSHGQKE